MARKTTETATDDFNNTFSAEERAAMKEHAAEVKATRKRGKATREDGENDLLAKVNELSEPDQTLARELHAIISAAAPELMPRTWYGMPAYARDGKVVCFFQPASKFGARYGTLGFNDAATLDDGEMWPTSFAVVELTPAVEQRIRELVARAVK